GTTAPLRAVCRLLGPLRLRLQSTRAPEARTTSPQRFTSAARIFSNSAGLVANGSAPCALKLSTTFGSANAALTVSLMRVMRAGGVPLGAIRPNQGLTSKLLKPASAMVGISGNDLARLALVTARARSAPPLIEPATDG